MNQDCITRSCRNIFEDTLACTSFRYRRVNLHSEVDNAIESVTEVKTQQIARCSHLKINPKRSRVARFDAGRSTTLRGERVDIFVVIEQICSATFLNSTNLQLHSDCTDSGVSLW